MQTAPAKHILIAPLDWGSGHTTRCIPVIRHLLAGGHRVTLAGNEEQHHIIRRNFPQIPLAYLQGYEVKYPGGGGSFAARILRQLPRLLKTVRREHHWLERFISEHRIDGVISDNRYGLYHSTVPSVILTHQPRILSGMGALADGLLRHAHYQFLERFGAVWLVDQAGTDNLAGRLSHPAALPPRAAYIGLLSQMTAGTAPEKEEHLLVLLSGPEPQRSLLQQILWQEVQDYPGPVVFIAGKIGDTVPSHIREHIRYYSHLTVNELQPLLEAASYILTRSGYSTLMDLAVLRKKALLIPTPGQTEQEYLARHLDEAGVFPRYTQNGFSLQEALKRAGQFSFHPLAAGTVNTHMEEVLDNWLTTI